MGLDRVRAANRATFAELVTRPEPDIDLARGALLIAAAGRPHLDPVAAYAELDRLAALVVKSGVPAPDAGQDGDLDRLAATLHRLHLVLYRAAGFRPPAPGTSNQPNHSLLDMVLTRRVGLPISLAIVQLEVARRVELPLHGVGLPGHFIVGGPGGLLLDPADGGRRLSRDDCQALIHRSLGRSVRLDEHMLRPAGHRAILARVLRNLRVARLVARDWPLALAAIELLEVLEPGDIGHPRDRGLLLGRMGRFSDAVALLGAYLELNPAADDAADVRQAMTIFAVRRN
jgi:regulator of sirC expression with transglutaminase-like and TPR domain